MNNRTFKSLAAKLCPFIRDTSGHKGTTNIPQMVYDIPTQLTAARTFVDAINRHPRIECHTQKITINSNL